MRERKVFDEHPFKQLFCRLTDHRYDWGTNSEPHCLRCGTDEYWPVRRTLGRLLSDAWRWWVRWWYDSDLPY